VEGLRKIELGNFSTTEAVHLHSLMKIPQQESYRFFGGQRWVVTSCIRVLVYVFTKGLKTRVAPAFRIDPEEGMFSRREIDI